MIKITKYEQQKCPSCGKLIDAATGFDEHRPSEDDFSVCINCRSVLQFDKNLKLRLSSIEEAEKCGIGKEVKTMIIHLANQLN